MQRQQSVSAGHWFHNRSWIIQATERIVYLFAFTPSPISWRYNEQQDLGSGRSPFEIAA